MPLTRFVADALGVVTICLVTLLVLLGLLCILYSFYFRTRIRSQGFIQLGYFSGPWIIRITFILFAIWWGFGEIVRLSLLRREGRVLNALNLKWQETVCKCYIVSNLGFAEPCLFVTLVFLLRASLQKSELGTLSRKWNGKTAGYVLLYCLPVFVLQLIVILIGPQFNKDESLGFPHYFTRTSTKTKDQDVVALCTYPLLSTIFLGLFGTVLTTYLFWLGRRILNLVINKGLQKRVYTLIFSVSGFFPLRVLLLGLSVLSTPELFLFEALAFLAFLSLLCCAGVSICVLVYCPVADSLALGNLQDIEARRRISEEHNDTISLIANQIPPEENIESSPGRNSVASAKRGSISFRTIEKNETSGAFVELSLFSPSQHSTPPVSPRLIGWPMLSPTQVDGP
uniref:Plasminogen activator inhibitor n=1 Tax=Davidia involucrata TaxID=16924 RepID=A0A5B6ZZL7_DAVIN